MVGDILGRAHRTGTVDLGVAARVGEQGEDRFGRSRDHALDCLDVGHGRTIPSLVATHRGDGYLAFICAMPIELTPLVRNLGLTPTEIGGVSAHTGTLADRDVVAIVTGMGTELARRHTTRLLDAVPVAR